jgi:hypothetical protein
MAAVEGRVVFFNLNLSKAVQTLPRFLDHAERKISRLTPFLERRHFEAKIGEKFFQIPE